jgi:high-affinity nickel permease
VFGADFFLTLPGALLLVIGFIPLCLLALGPLTIWGVTLSVNSMLLGLLTSILGLQMSLTGAIAQSLYDGTGRKRQRWLKMFSYTRTTIAAAVAFAVGLILVLQFVAAFIQQNYSFNDALVDVNHQAIFGVFLMMASLLVFVSMLLIHAIGLYVPIPLRPAAKNS